MYDVTKSFDEQDQDIFLDTIMTQYRNTTTTEKTSTMTTIFLLLLLHLLAIGSIVTSSTYAPTWESLDARPLPQWYPDAKFGIFLHWGVFSVPSFGSEWFQFAWQGTKTKSFVDFVENTEGPRFSYQDYAHRFDASLYEPDDWAQVFADAGAQYVVLTSKHHEGYCMWDSRDVPTTWNWNVMDVGPKRDLLGDLAKAVKNTTSPHTKKRVKFGVYHSLFEWYNPLYTRDQRNGYTTNDFVTTKTIPELYDLVKKYEPELIWSDGEWDASSEYWQSKEFLAWLANDSPVSETVVWNDRWGNETSCKHGSFLTCTDRYQPDSLNPTKWENCDTVDKGSWGYNRNASLSDYRSTEELVESLIATIALNGNFLLNVGPAADGTLHPIFVDRLLGLGTWLQVNGDAIYATEPWSVAQKDAPASVYYTLCDSIVYAIATVWPSNDKLLLTAPIPSSSSTNDKKSATSTLVRMLGMEEGDYLTWTSIDGGGLVIEVPALTPDKIPCQHAWVFALMNLENANNHDVPLHPQILRTAQR
jgi:alpha-L-fucosidase